MDPITIGGGLVIFVLAATAIAIDHYKTKIKSTNAAMDKLRVALGQYAEAYQFEECDTPVINAVKDYISSLRSGGSLADVMGSMDLDERKVFMQKIVREIANIMDIDLSNINIEYLQATVFGQSYMDGENYNIDLNEAILIADPDRLLQTACHELRHLQQMQALKKDKWGFSINRKAQWMMAFNYYVNAEDNSEIQYIAYVLQSIEVDANKFALEVNSES